MAVRGEGRPLHACVNSTNYFYIIVFYTVNSLLQQHTQKHVTYGKWVEIIIREFWNFIREKSGKNQGILFSWNAGNPVPENVIFTFFRMCWCYSEAYNVLEHKIWYSIVQYLCTSIWDLKYTFSLHSLTGLWDTCDNTLAVQEDGSCQHHSLWLQTVELNSESRDFVKIQQLPVFTRCLALSA